MYLSFFCFVVTVNGTTLIRNPQSQSGSRIHVLQVSTAYYYIQLPELLLLVFFFLILRRLSPRSNSDRDHRTCVSLVPRGGIRKK